MKSKKKNIIIGIILAILMIIAIVIGIVNPSKVQTINMSEDNQSNAILENEISNNNIMENNIITLSPEKIEEQEEKEYSMQERDRFCVIGNIGIYFDVDSLDLYIYNFETNESKKIANLKFDPSNIYFDGTNIYVTVPYYNTIDDKGIYKIDLDGNIQKIYEDFCLQIALTDNKIYFVKQIGYDDVNQNPQGELCSMNKDGNEITKLADSVKNYFYLQNDKIYFTSQDRKMCKVNIDGTNQEELAQGRKFVIAVTDKYLIYTDFSDKEAKHILELDTKEDRLIGYFGTAKKYNGNVYVSARKRAEDGSIEEQFSVFKIDSLGNISELGKIDDIETEEQKNCQFFVAGYGYKVTALEGEKIKIEKIKI